MTRKEIAEIRKRFNPERNNVTVIRGCYVNQDGEIISEFAASPLAMPEEEADKYLSIFKKTLSGIPDKNLVDMSFTTEQVREGVEHALLMKLRDSALTDDEAVEEFFSRIIETFKFEDNYLILLMHDAYDVPAFTLDDQPSDSGADVFHYLICSICPVRLSKPALRYCVSENEFHTRALDYIVNMPETGFMFPTFDERKTNIYNALLYLRDPAKTYDDMTGALFNAERPIPAAEQKETFREILEDSLGEECSLDVVQAVHEQLSEKIREQQADKEAEPLKVTRNEMRNMLVDCGVSSDKVDAFTAQYDEKIGAGVDLSPVNIVEPKKFSVKTPDVVISVDPERADLVETRIIDGVRYILVRAEEGVEVNGVAINISAQDGQTCPF